MPPIQVIESVAVVVNPTEVSVGVDVNAQPQVVEIGVIGPQGPQGPIGPVGPPGSNTLANLTDVNVNAKVNNSVLYYDQSSSKFVANDVNTIVTITDGGNF